MCRVSVHLWRRTINLDPFMFTNKCCHDKRVCHMTRNMSDLSSQSFHFPQPACNLIYLVTLQPLLSTVCLLSRQIVTDITRRITTIIPPLINANQKGRAPIIYFFYPSLLRPLYDRSDIRLFFVFHYSIEPSNLRRCLFSLILFIWF